MGAAGVDIAEGAVDAVLAEDGGGAAVVHQGFHRLGALVRDDGRVVAHLHPLGHGQRLAGLGALGHQLEVAQQHGAAFVHRDHGIGQGGLRAGVLDDAPAVVDSNAALVGLDEQVDGPLQGTDGGRRHGAHEDLAEGQAEQRGGVHRVARAVLQEAVDGAVGAVLRHEHVLHQDVVGAGGFQAHHIPVVEDGVVRAGDQEGAVVRAVTFLLRRHHGAEEGPLAVLAAGGKAPAAAEAEAAVHAGDLAHRHVGRGDQYARILAPDILRRAVVEQCQLPVVDGHHAEHPGR
ncbi:hypothetical protein D3C78_1186030 [compost metagenome]